MWASKNLENTLLTRAVDRRKADILGFLFGRNADLVTQVKPLFIVCFAGFIFSMGVGWYMGGSVGEMLNEELSSMIPDIADMDLISLFIFIVLNNALKNFLWMILGLLGALPSLYFSFFNGFILGSVAYTFNAQTNFSVTLAGLLPHGIIEIPTMVLCSAIGMALGYSLINRLRGKKGLRVKVGKAISLYFRRILPLVVIAAIIEVTITPVFIALFALTL